MSERNERQVYVDAHVKMHESLDGLLSCFIFNNPGRHLRDTSIMELIKWSHLQSTTGDCDEAHHRSDDTPDRTAFLRDMVEELARAEAMHDAYRTHHEAYAVIKEELDEFWDIVRMSREDRIASDTRAELVQIAVTAWRTARDVLRTD